MHLLQLARVRVPPPDRSGSRQVSISVQLRAVSSHAPPLLSLLLLLVQRNQTAYTPLQMVQQGHIPGPISTTAYSLVVRQSSSKMDYRLLRLVDPFMRFSRTHGRSNRVSQPKCRLLRHHRDCVVRRCPQPLLLSPGWLRQRGSYHSSLFSHHY